MVLLQLHYRTARMIQIHPLSIGFIIWKVKKVQIKALVKYAMPSMQFMAMVRHVITCMPDSR